MFDVLKNNIYRIFTPIPKHDADRNHKKIFFLFVISLFFFLWARFISPNSHEDLFNHMEKASQRMSDAMAILKDCRESRGLDIESLFDINRTGLIGEEYTIITTTIGQLEAKRTSTSPNFAGLLLYLLREAGVSKGDRVAVGASSSFPALILAVHMALETLEAVPLTILSLGASQWGANHPEFSGLDMWYCLQDKGFFKSSPIALSVGGENDTGRDMDQEGRRLLKDRIEKSGLVQIKSTVLQKNVEERIGLYRREAGEFPIKAFVNIGGSWANLGTDSAVLTVKPGLSKTTPPVGEEKRGVLLEMGTLGIPVIHCLFIRGLAQQYGLDWDPQPLPRPGEGRLHSLIRSKQSPSLLIASLYFLTLGSMLAFWRKR